MKRRSFFKLFAAAPAAIALPAIAESKGNTYVGPCQPHGTGSHHNHIAPCEIPSHSHSTYPCPGCYYEAVPYSGSPHSHYVPRLVCVRSRRHCTGGTA